MTKLVDKLRDGLMKTMSLPEIRDALNKQGAEVLTNTPEEFQKFVQEELKKFGPVVKMAGLKVE